MVFRRGRQTDDAHQERPSIQPVVIDVVARADLTPVSQWVEGGPIPARPMPPGPTSALFAGVCRYYHDCFSADSRGGMLTNVLDKNQAEYLVFADGVELLADRPGATGSRCR